MRANSTTNNSGSALTLLAIAFLFVPFFSHAEQVQIFDQDVSWANEADYDRTYTGPLSQFKNGTTYVRLDIKEKPTDYEVGVQLCINDGGKEACSWADRYLVTTTGVYYFNMENVSDWWSSRGGPDWSKTMADWNVVTFLFRDTAKGYCQFRLDGGHKCANVAEHVPIVFHIDVLFVAEGSTLVQPADWTNCPAEWGCTSGGAATTTTTEPTVPPATTATTPPPASAVPCHRLSVLNAIPPGFGASFDTVSQALLIKGMCRDGGIDISVGNAADLALVVYKGGHVYQNTWQAITLNGPSPLAGGAWFSAIASAFLPRTTAKLGEDTFFVGYVCKWNDPGWKCGCRDSACTTNHWQLQVFRR